MTEHDEYKADTSPSADAQKAVAQQRSAMSDRPSLPDLPGGPPDEVRVLMTRYAMRAVDEALRQSGELRAGIMPQSTPSAPPSEATGKPALQVPPSEAQKAVAWMEPGSMDVVSNMHRARLGRPEKYSIPLYTHPTASTTAALPLTEERILADGANSLSQRHPEWRHFFISGVHYAERAHGIRTDGETKYAD